MASLLIVSAVLIRPADGQVASATPELKKTDTRPEQLLARQVTVDLNGVSVKRALDALAKTSGVPLQYRAQTVDAYKTLVTVHLTGVSLRVALDHVLRGTRLTVLADRAGHLMIVDNDADATAAATSGEISGRVVDARTKQPLHGASVLLDDSVRHSRTDEDGRFSFTDVATGSHRIVVRFVGYTRQVKVVHVGDDSTAAVTIALETALNTLDQVVVTATGPQRYRELGHVVATVNADSLVKEAPITSVSELLQSRIPGLQVITTNGGVAGAPVALRLRGQTSLNLNSEPVIVIDGVRYRSNSMVQQNGFAQQDFLQAGGTPPSPLNDLNVNDIETVEVVKGPSASTLYGPEASNGVIVITTKHAKTDRTTWSWYAHPVLNTVPAAQRLARKAYQVWGHDSNGNPIDYCNLIYQYRYHICTIDSVTLTQAFFADPKTSILGKNRPEWQYGLNLSGGTGSTRYYVSGGYDNQEGALQVPALVQQAIQRKLGTGELSDDIRNPNSMKKVSLHTNVNMQPWSPLDLQATVDYVQSVQHRINPNNIFQPFGQQVLSPYATTDSAIAQSLNDNLFFTGFALTKDVADMTAFTGSMHAVFRATSWLTADGLLGTTRDGTNNHMIYSAGAGGQAQDDDRASNGRTVTFGLTAIAHPGRWSFRSVAGTQYIYQKDDGLTTQGFDLAPGSNSIATAATIYLQQYWSETVTLGTYGQETIGLNDRLFVDMGLRVDGSTRFGDAYHPTPLPKVGISWIASDEPGFKDHLPWISELRFRGSYGQATRYPTSGMKLGGLSSGIVPINGQRSTGYYVSNLPNPDLRPERSREGEYGADATLFSRLQLELTWWRRRTIDELKALQNPTGAFPVWRNVASVGQHGTEITATLPLTDTRMFRSDVRLTYAFNTSKILSLGDNAPAGGYIGLAKGYPLDAILGIRTIGVVDTLGGGPDGVAEGEEVVREPTFHYLGVFNPPRAFTLTPSASMFGGRLRMSAVFDRETGFVVHDDFGMYCGFAHTCLGPYDRSIPLLQQAKSTFQNFYDFLVPGDFTRWREMDITMDVPLREWLHLSALHLDALSHVAVSLQGRNLALWTRYRGSDPESRSDAYIFSSNASGIPQPRGWALRFDITP